MDDLMVKIVIMGWKSFSKIAYKELDKGVRTGSFSKQDGIIYAESWEAAMRVLSPERMKLLSTVKDTNPVSLYALAKTMKKDFKTVFTDVKYLSDAGLLTLENHKQGARIRVRPVFKGNKINVEIAV